MNLMNKREATIEDKGHSFREVMDRQSKLEEQSKNEYIPGMSLRKELKKGELHGLSSDSESEIDRESKPQLESPKNEDQNVDDSRNEPTLRLDIG